MKSEKLVPRRCFPSAPGASRPPVHGGHGAFLLVGQSQDAQGQHLIDFRAVEEVARTFRRHLRVIVEDDRRGEQRIRLPLLADEDRPGADIAAGVSRFAPTRGWIEQRNELAPLDAKERVRRSQGAQHRLLAVGVSALRHRCTVLDAECQAEQSLADLDGWTSISPVTVCCSRTMTPATSPSRPLSVSIRCPPGNAKGARPGST